MSDKVFGEKLESFAKVIDGLLADSKTRDMYYKDPLLTLKKHGIEFTDEKVARRVAEALRATSYDSFKEGRTGSGVAVVTPEVVTAPLGRVGSGVAMQVGVVTAAHPVSGKEHREFINSININNDSVATFLNDVALNKNKVELEGEVGTLSMDEGKDQTLNETVFAKEQSEGKTQGIRSPLIIIMGAIIVLLIGAFLLMGTPLKEYFFAGNVPPEIYLELVDGPKLEENSKYRFEVKAVVSGNPTPEVFFSRDDSLGETGAGRALIFLDPGETLTLTVAARNSQGSSNASLELVAGIEEATNGEEGTEEAAEDVAEETEEEVMEPPANFNPVISGFAFSSSPLFIKTDYTITAQASDPDGDDLTYNWEVTSERFAPVTATGNPMILQTPARPCELMVKLTVKDDKGGETEHSQQVIINPVYILAAINTESGHIYKDYAARPGGIIYVGDDEGRSGNFTSRAYISFDMKTISGTVHRVELYLDSPIVTGNPTFMHGNSGLWLEKVYWGTRPLALSDYDLAYVPISSYSNYDIALIQSRGDSFHNFIDVLQQSINENEERFQIRLRYDNEVSNQNKLKDGVEYLGDNIVLKLYIVE